jgi:MFS family permease
MTDHRTKWSLLLTATISYALMMFAWFSLAAYLTPVIGDLGLTETQAGVIAGAVPLTYVPVALLSGPLIDRVGPYRAIGAGMLLLGVAQLGRSVAVTFPTMLAFTVLLGIGATGISFGLPKLVSALFPVDGGTPSAVYILGSIGGNAAAFSLGRGVLGPAIGGWRPLFVATGIACLLYVVLWTVVVRLAAPDRSDWDVSGDMELGGIGRDVRTVVANPEMRLLMVIGVAYLMTIHGVSNWLTAVLESRGFRPGTAATVTSGFVITQAAGTLTIPPLADRLGRRSGVIAGCGLACAGGTVLLLLEGAPLTVLVVGVVAAGVGVGGLSPLIRLIPAEIEEIGPALTGTAVGVTFSAGQVGGFVSPFLIGSLQDVTGSYLPGFLILSGCCLGAAIAGRQLSV